MDDDAEKVDGDNNAGSEEKTPAEEATTEADVSYRCNRGSKQYWS